MRGRKAFSLERVRKVAAKAFTERAFDSVSVAEIAAQAHCSTATIYEVYSSKSALFLDAVAYDSAVRPAPQPQHDDGAPSLDSLLRFASDRIDYLLDHSYGYQHAGGFDAEGFRSFAESSIAQHNPFRSVMVEVRRNMEAGLLRPGDVEAVSYTICAGVGFEPVVHKSLFGSDARLDAAAIIRMVFTPLVTRKGNTRLKAFLARLPAAPRRSERAMPTLLDDFHTEGLTGGATDMTGAQASERS